jgi:predicted nucleotidyltransferase
MLSKWDQTILTQAYGLSKREVALDLTLLQTACGPRDDAFVELRQRHGWSAGRTYAYLRTPQWALRNELPS